MPYLNHSQDIVQFSLIYIPSLVLVLLQQWVLLQFVCIASSTDPFVILIFGLALDLVLGLGFGLTSSSSTIVSITASFTGSSSLINYSICSLDPSSTIFWLFIYYLTKITRTLNWIINQWLQRSLRNLPERHVNELPVYIFKNKI